MNKSSIKLLSSRNLYQIACCYPHFVQLVDVRESTNILIIVVVKRGYQSDRDLNEISIISKVKSAYEPNDPLSQSLSRLL